MVAPLWSPEPEQRASSHLEHFRRRAEAASGQTLPDYAALLRWSLDERPAFWSLLWDFADVRGEKGAVAARHEDQLTGTDWFPEARLNFAENLLPRRDDGVALIARSEAGADLHVTWAELAEHSERVAAYLRAHGVTENDRVAGVLINGVEAVVAMLATARIGAIWSSCSPDFGGPAIIDRFGQIEPAFLFGSSRYRYAGREFDCRDKLSEVVAALPGLAGHVDVTERWDELIGHPEREADFTPRHFDDPVYIMFSSGTTGVPKCIVHSVGGALLQHRKEHLLHCDVHPQERLFFHTTCGWMMWNWLVGGLASEATTCLYDGAPTHPGPEALFQFVEDARIAHFGISPGFAAAVANAGYTPNAHHDLSSLRAILSTGSPLPAESFHWLTEHVAPVRVSSITGGTDILGCFALGNPTAPVYAGEIQCVGLGMDVAFFDDDGRALTRGKGELVCRQSFPSMPIGFWNDRDGTRYHAAYFEAIPGVWHHGDFGEFTPQGGIIIHGRSDAVLNRGGVRIGTAELYRHAERVDEVVECLAVAREAAGDVQIVLFVRLKDGASLTPEAEQRIRQSIRSGASPRHVPDVIHAVADLPRTRSGKLLELAVRDVIHGRPVKNIGAIANPEALALFENLDWS